MLTFIIYEWEEIEHCTEKKISLYKITYNRIFVLILNDVIRQIWAQYVIYDYLRILMKNEYISIYLYVFLFSLFIS